MGLDVSVLFLPEELPLEEIAQTIFEMLDEGDDIGLLVTRAKAGPSLRSGPDGEPSAAALAALAARFPGYQALSLWSPDPLVWDELAAALSEGRAQPLLALSSWDHGGVSCWQPFHEGKAGQASWWERDTQDMARAAFRSVYQLEAEAEVDELVLGACEGLWLTFLPEPRSRALERATIDELLSGEHDFSCCLFEHGLGESRVEVEEGPPAAREVEPPPPASAEDRALVQSLLALSGLSPGKRIFVQDLERRVLAVGGELTAGQRERARALLDAAG
ncbi:MAG: hypothetical protein AB7N76_31730 [Planctomycetota bacterium]